MTRPSRDAMLAAAALLAVMLTAWLTQRQSAMPFDSFASSDYASGGYRAFALLLERERVRVETFDRVPIALESSLDTLVSAQPLGFAPQAAPRTPAELADLAAWVRRGGRLVYIGRNAALAADERRYLLLPPIGTARTVARGSFTGEVAPLVHTLAQLGRTRIAIAPRADITEVLGDRSGSIAVRYPLGAGEIVAVTAQELFANRALALAGNARLAYAIAVPRHADGRVAFDEGLHGELRGVPWYRALTPPELLALAILAIAAFLALVGGLVRTGPPIALHAKREPTSAEFVAALAALRERTHARTLTQAAIVEATLALAARNGRSGDAQLNAFATASAQPPRTDADLLESARRAFLLRKELTHGRISDGRRAAFAGRIRNGRRG